MALPEVGFLRLRQIIGDPGSPGHPGDPNASPPKPRRRPRPPVPALIPVSKSTWWDGVASGRFPPGVRIGPRMRAWSAEEIRELMRRFCEDRKAV